MSTLVVRDEVVLLGQAREDLAPHLLVRHERVDKDKPRGTVVALGDEDLERDASVDFDVVLLLDGLGERDFERAHVSDVEGDEETRHHVVRGHDGGRLEELLVVLEIYL